MTEYLELKTAINKAKKITDRQALQLTKIHADLYKLKKPKIPCRNCPKEWRKLMNQIDIKLTSSPLSY